MSAEKYKETLDFLFNALPVWEKLAGAAAYKPGTERVLEFARTVGSPHERLRTIHIAGTNGKGSTASMLAAVLQSAGYRTGLYTSPHLVDFRERIRIDGQMIPQAAVVEFAERYRDEMVRLGMTFFEMATVMALWFFEREGVNIAVIETGLGGRHDATNIITPILSVITNIGLEHTQYLGDTIEKIAREKAGIIKRGVPVVVGETDPETAPVFLSTAAQAGSEIIFADNYRSSIVDYRLDLAGIYQRKNLRTVLAAIDELRRGGLEIPEEAVRRGLVRTARLTGLRGRWEVVGEHPSAGSGQRPRVVLDTAHNAHGFGEIARALDEWRAQHPDGAIWMVLGFAADKNIVEIARLLPPDANVVLTQADSPRSMPVMELAEKFSISHLPFSITFSVAEAVEKAMAAAGRNDLVYIGGSNFVVGEFLERFLTSCS